MSKADRHLARPITDFDLSTRTVNCLRNAGVETIGELAALRSTDVVSWLNAGKRTLAEVRSLLSSLGLSLADDLSLDLEGGTVVAPTGEAATEMVAEATTLDSQLYGLVKRVSSERDTNILLKLWGWNGERPRTLESVGSEFGLTRERVRQIEKRARERLKKYDFDGRLVRAAIAVLEDATPEAEPTLREVLRDRGVSDRPFSPDGLQIAAERWGIEWPFDVFELEGQRVLALRSESAKYANVASRLRRNTSHRGCTSLLSLASDVGLDDSRIPGLRRVIRLMSAAEWLSEDWVYDSRSPRNRLINICTKILGVAPKLHLAELRRAAGQSRRLLICPPQAILASFVERSGLGRVQGGMVIAKRGIGAPPSADSVEGRMLRVLEEHGPVMDGEAFAEKCIAAGVNGTSFYIIRAASPVICAMGKGVYCKVGATVPPGSVENIVRQRRAHSRVTDYGWTSAGNLWCAIELPTIVIVGGSIRLPSFVAELVQGEWTVTLPDRSEIAKATCKDQFLYSLKKAFVVLGAEANDLAGLLFDLKARRVLVKVGGPSLLEQLQSSESDSTDESTEET